MNRRTFMTRGGGPGLAGGGASLRGKAIWPSQSLTAGHRDKIQESLRWLAQQQAADGSFGTGAYTGNVAVTSLAGLAFMSAGNQPGRGAFGANVTAAVRYILSCESRDAQTPGFINSRRSASHGPMYGHGFATLFLAEVYGMVNDSALRTELRGTLGRAIRLIISSQNQEGGWRYQPRPQDADLSVTICQIMALRAARNAGIAVPKSTADKCTDYVKKCQDASGGFRYQAGGGPPGFARTAAGVVALFSAGEYEGEAVDKGLNYLKNFRPAQAGGIFNENMIHYHYGHYYAVQAMWIKGGQTTGGNWFPSYPRRAFRQPSAKTARGRWASCARTTARRWPSSSCRCPTTTCRSSNGRTIEPRGTKAQCPNNLQISECDYRLRRPRLLLEAGDLSYAPFLACRNLGWDFEMGIC